MAALTLFIVGPTASGKTALALELAQAFNGEIICADSRTVYKGLDIATAKPTPAEQALVPHWGLDLVEPTQRFSAADFKAYALAAIADIHSRGKVPVIVGGTGLYIDGLLFDFQYGEAADPAVRAGLEAMSLDELQTLILERDIEIPTNENNKRHLIRAIEQGGVNRQKQPMMAGALVVGLLPERAVLDERIRLRTATMVASGAVQEARELFEHYGYDAPAAAAPFYKAFASHFVGGASIDDCAARSYLLERQLSKRQIAWFKRNKAIHWFSSAAEARAFVHSQI